MTTERLYYLDPALTSFRACIRTLERHERGMLCRLDRSAFYPTSGGQLHDLGQLGNAAVVCVEEDADGDVIHLLDRSPGAAGDEVFCEIDRRRRRRNRQLHTAQHIMSQAFQMGAGRETVSVHLGETYGAVELAGFPLGSSEIKAARVLIDQVISDSLPISIHMVERSEISRFPLRKQPERDGLIRVIQIGEFDYSACGGTHCLRTSEVGMVAIIGIEKLRGNALVKFLAGDLAQEDYLLRLDQTRQLSEKLSCGVADVSSQVDRLVAEQIELRNQVKQLQAQLLPTVAKQIAETATLIGQVKVVVSAREELVQFPLNQLASLIATAISGVAVIALDGRLVVASVVPAPCDAQSLVRLVTTKLNVKGGGSSQLSQLGGCSPETLSQAIDLIRASLSSQ